MTRSLFASLGGAGALGVLLCAVEAWRASAASGGFWSFFMVAAAQILPLVAIAAVPIALVALLAGSRFSDWASTVRATEHVSNALFWALQTIVVAVISAFVVGRFAERHRTTVILATVVAVVVASLLVKAVDVAGAGGLRRVVHAFAQRLPDFFRTWRGLFVAGLAAVLLGVLLFFKIAPDYAIALPWGFPVVVATGLIGATLGVMFASAWRTLTMLFVLAAALLAWSAVQPPTQEATQALVRRGVFTRGLQSLTSPTRPRVETTGQPVTCRPGERISVPGSLGKVGPNAPDIIFVTVDGWRFDHSSFAPLERRASARDFSPQLANLAQNAAVFTRAYTPAPNTRHSFRSVFTGLYPGQAAAPRTPGLPWAASLDPAQPALASYLSSAGYETTAFISKPKAFPSRHNILVGFTEVDASFSRFHRTHRYSASLKVNRLMGRFAEPPHDQTRPRFLWTHLIEPHSPFRQGPEFMPPAGATIAQRYAGSIKYVDQQLGRLVEFATGPERGHRTWIVISSDHGEAFGEHDNRAHGGTVYEEEIHVPLLVWGPGVVPGLRHEPVSLVDVLPTLLDVAGLKTPSGLCGRSLLSAIKSGSEPKHRPVYSAAIPDNTRDYFELAYIDGNDKLVVHGHTGVTEAYDLSRDPKEKNMRAPTDAELDSFRQFLTERGLKPEEHGLVESAQP